MERREPLVRLGEALSATDRLERIEDRLDGLTRAIAVQSAVYGLLLLLILATLVRVGLLL